MINWRVRVKNPNFWLALVPALLLAVQAAGALVGWDFQPEGIQGKLLDAVNAVFGLLTILGVVNDPTTAGLQDSVRAMGYAAPAGLAEELDT